MKYKLSEVLTKEEFEVIEKQKEEIIKKENRFKVPAFIRRETIIKNNEDK